MATTFTGRNAYITVSGTTVAELNNWSIELASNPIEGNAFGSTWGKTYGLGVNKWSGSFEGYFVSDDTNGQNFLRDAQLNETKIQDAKFYLGSTVYYHPDTATDATAGIYISNHTVTAAQDEIITISFSFTGSGPLALTTVSG